MPSQNRINQINLTLRMKRLSVLYGFNNERELPLPHDRLDYLLVGIEEVARSIRKGFGPELISIALARVFARLTCFIDGLHTAHYFFSFAFSLAKKYPRAACRSCAKTICLCPRNRSAISFEISPDPIQVVRWDLEHWQDHFDHVFGAVNRENGLEALLLHLYEEYVELMKAWSIISSVHIMDSDGCWLIASECADVFAFIMAIGNYYRANVQRAAQDRYGNGCWKCNALQQCRCQPVRILSATWEPLAA